MLLRKSRAQNSVGDSPTKSNRCGRESGRTFLRAVLEASGTDWINFHLKYIISRGECGVRLIEQLFLRLEIIALVQ